MVRSLRYTAVFTAPAVVTPTIRTPSLATARLTGPRRLCAAMLRHGPAGGHTHNRPSASTANSIVVPSPIRPTAGGDAIDPPINAHGFQTNARHW